MRKHQHKSHAELEFSTAAAADVSDDFPSNLDIDVQTPDGVVVELQLHKSAITDDVPLLVMRNGGIVRIPLPSTDVSTRHNGVATVCKVGWLKLCPKTIYFIRHSVLEVGLKT